MKWKAKKVDESELEFYLNSIDEEGYEIHRIDLLEESNSVTRSKSIQNNQYGYPMYTTPGAATATYPIYQPTGESTSETHFKTFKWMVIAFKQDNVKLDQDVLLEALMFLEEDEPEAAKEVLKTLQT